MIRQLSALALNGFREAIRNRVTLVMAIFAVGLLLSSSLVTEVTVVTFARVLTDLGLGSMGILLSLLAIFLASGTLPRELERKTIFLILSRPMPRGVFLVAKLAGNLLTLGVLLLGMGAVLLGQLLLLKMPLGAPIFVAIPMLWLELLVISSVGILMSSFAGQMVSVFVTTSICFAGYLTGDIYRIAAKSSNPLLQLLGKAAYYVLPNLQRINYRPYAALEITMPSTQLLPSIAYAIAYSVMATALATLLFSRRDFR